MVTKDQFMESLDALTCSLCLEVYTANHIPVQLPCNHIFGDYCIANVVESELPQNNRCPLCRQKLFEQEDFDENGDRIIDDEEFATFGHENSPEEDEEMARHGELLVEVDETVAALALPEELDNAAPAVDGLSLMGEEESVASLALPEEH